MVFPVVIKSDLFFNWDRVYIPVGVVTNGVDISDLYNCMICMLWFLITAHITPLDCRDCHAEISTPIHNGPHWCGGVVTFWMWGITGNTTKSWITRILSLGCNPRRSDCLREESSSQRLGPTASRVALSEFVYSSAWSQIDVVAERDLMVVDPCK